MEQTANYQLNLWEKTDRIQMEDFNADNAKIDAALAAQAAALAPITAQIGKLGNCQLYTTTYTGNDTSYKAAITFPGKPIVVMVSSPDGTYRLICWHGATKAPLLNYNQYFLTLTWSGHALQWNFDGNVDACLNRSNTTYRVAALLDMSAE